MSRCTSPRLVKPSRYIRHTGFSAIPVAAMGLMLMELLRLSYGVVGHGWEAGGWQTHHVSTQVADVDVLFAQSLRTVDVSPLRQVASEYARTAVPCCCSTAVHVGRAYLLTSAGLAVFCVVALHSVLDQHRSRVTAASAAIGTCWHFVNQYVSAGATVHWLWRMHFGSCNSPPIAEATRFAGPSIR